MGIKAVLIFVVLLLFSSQADPAAALNPPYATDSFNLTLISNTCSGGVPSVSFSWSDQTNTISYDIWRFRYTDIIAGTGFWEYLTRVPDTDTNPTTYLDNNLISNTKYNYRVIANKNDGSATASGTDPASDLSLTTTECTPPTITYMTSACNSTSGTSSSSTNIVQPGKVGNARTFNGVNDYVATGDSISLSSGTIAFFFKPNVNWAPASGPSSPVIDGLVSYYDMDEASGATVDDKHGPNNGTTAGNTGGPTVVAGIKGNARSFTRANNDRVNFSVGAPISGSFTISLWAKLADLTSNPQYILDDDAGHEKPSLFGKPNSADGLKFRINSNNPNARTLTLNSTSAWYHIVMVQDTSTTTNNQRIYVNGVLKEQVNRPAPFDSIGSFTLGALTGGTGSGFSGLIDEVGIWNRALNLQEINKIYNGAKAFAYPFAETQGLWGKYQSNDFNATISIRANDFTQGAGLLSSIQTKFENYPNFLYLATADSTRTWNAGEWYHYGLTWDGTGTKVYINGILNNSTATTVTLPALGLNQIGRSFYDSQNITDGNTTPHFFNGTIDEFGIWKRALSATEIFELFEGATFTSPSTRTFFDDPPNELVSYYKMDETSGQNVEDSVESNKPFVTIYWDDTSTQNVSYKVWRSELLDGGGTGPPTQVASNITTKSYSDYNVLPNKYYAYQVVGVKSDQSTTMPSNWAWIPNAVPDCDTTPPTVVLDPLKTCYTPSEWPSSPPTGPQPVKATADDLGLVTTGVSSVKMRIQNLTTLTALEADAANSGTNIWQHTFTAADLTALGGTGYKYRLQAKATDGAGNTSLYSSSTPADFFYQTVCTNPWLQTKTGDVHSNKEINTPGGP